MEEFQNNPVLENDLPSFEDVYLTPVSRKFLKIIYLNLAIFAGFMAIAAISAYFFLREHIDLNWTVVFVVAGIFVILISLLNYISFFQRKYAVREKDIVYHDGLIQHNILIIPFNRIQHIAIFEGWYSRILGLKSVKIFTAGSLDLTINGLPKEVAENFSQLILDKIREEELIEGQEQDFLETNKVDE